MLTRPCRGFRLNHHYTRHALNITRKSPLILQQSRISTWTPLSCMPSSLVPYAQLARWDKPAGTWLLWLPCTWSMSMAAYTTPTLSLLDTTGMMALFGVGAFVMRGAGCTINDMWDKDLDKQVQRTQSRPLASGALNMQQALVFLTAQLGCGLAVLTQLNLYSILLGASSLLLVTTYPLMKRITFWPQAYLGLTFNWGALVGWSALMGSCDLSVVLPLYASGICWTLLYDTIYAFQDKKDDARVGIKSTALYIQHAPLRYLSVFATSQVVFLVLAGLMNAQGPLFYIVSVGGSMMHLIWQLTTLQPDNVQDAWKKFKSNTWLGGCVTLGIVLDMLYKRMQEKDKDRVVQEKDMVVHDKDMVVQ